MAVALVPVAAASAADWSLTAYEPPAGTPSVPERVPPGEEVDPVAAMGEIRGHVCGEQPTDCCEDCCEDCCCEECCEPCCPSCWYVEGDGLFLDRSKSRNIKIVENGTGPPPRGQRITVMTTDALDFDDEWGPRIVIGNRDECRDLEVVYYGFQHWQSTAVATMGNPEVDVPFDSADFNINGVLRPISDFDGAQRVEAIYASELHNFEANWWATDGRLWQPMVGFRYFDLDEEFDLRSTDTNETSDYLIDAENNLVGLQTGLRYEQPRYGRFTWNVLGKAGAYVNFASQDTLLRDDNNSVLIHHFTPHDEDIAFIGELGVNARYAISKNIELTCGYLLLWVDGVALAPEQLDFTTTATSGSTLHNDGDAVFDGGYVGVRITH